MKLPEAIFKPPFSITRMSHAVMQVSDLDASLDFYSEVLGMAVSDRSTDTIWLRGLEEGCHHSLVLKHGIPGCERVGFRVLIEDDLDLVEAHFRSAGLPTSWVEVPYQSRTLHTVDPVGTPLEFCVSMEVRPRLFHHVELYRGASAQRIDHVQVLTPGVAEAMRFYMGMGFRMSEYVLPEGASDPVFIFLQRKGNPHDVVFANRGGLQLHHVAYTVADTAALIHTAELMVRRGEGDRVEFGPARHFSPGLARFLYIRDPDGHRVELFPSHYQTMDIEDAPVRWTPEEFRIGGWQEPPQRWLDEAIPFVQDKRTPTSAAAPHS